MYLHLKLEFITFMYVQDDLRGKVNTSKVDSVGHFEKKSPYEHVSKSAWLPS
jgi:hypothetical protein